MSIFAVDEDAEDALQDQENVGVPVQGAAVAPPVGEDAQVDDEQEEEPLAGDDNLRAFFEACARERAAEIANLPPLSEASTVSLSDFEDLDAED